MEHDSCGGFCGDCKRMKKGFGMLVLGVVLILSRVYYPSWDIWVVLGVLAILAGLSKLVFRHCPHCNEPTKPARSRR